MCFSTPVGMADRLTIDHYVGECFYKCSQVVLASRVVKPSAPTDTRVENAPASSSKRSSKWVRGPARLALAKQHTKPIVVQAGGDHF